MSDECNLPQTVVDETALAALLVRICNLETKLADFEQPECGDCDGFLAPVLIPAPTFADPADPQQAEVNAWVAINGTGQEGQLYYHPNTGTATNPDFIWSDNGDGTATFIEKVYSYSGNQVTLSGATPTIAITSALALAQVPGTPMKWEDPNSTTTYHYIKTPATGAALISMIPGDIEYIPDVAFADPTNPTSGEAETWLNANKPYAAPESIYFSSSGARYIYKEIIEEPGEANPIEIPDGAFADPNVPTTAEASVWTTASGSKLPGQLYYAEGNGTSTEPEYFWVGLGDGSVQSLEKPFPITQNLVNISGADEATALASAAAVNASPGTMLKWQEPGNSSDYFYLKPESGLSAADRIAREPGSAIAVPDGAFFNPNKPLWSEVQTWKLTNAPWSLFTSYFTTTIGYVFNNGVIVKSPDPVAPIEIPDGAFAVPATPTTAEAATWIQTNGSDVVNQLYYSDGTGSQYDPEFIWVDHGDGINVTNIKGL